MVEAQRTPLMKEVTRVPWRDRGVTCDRSATVREISVFAKKTTLGKFDAKVFFEVRRTLIDVVFGEESESEVKMVKNPSKKCFLVPFSFFLGGAFAGS